MGVRVRVRLSARVVCVMHVLLLLLMLFLVSIVHLQLDVIVAYVRLIDINVSKCMQATYIGSSIDYK